MLLYMKQQSLWRNSVSGEAEAVKRPGAQIQRPMRWRRQPARRTTTPARVFGENNVDFGGMTVSASATVMS